MKWKILKIIILSFIIIFPVRYFAAQPFKVIGSSMEPSLEGGDYLVIDKISYKFREPKRGEIVVFHSSPKDFFVKRVIGLPGETVQIKQGSVYIYNNNKKQWIKLSENYILANTKTSPEMKAVLAENEYFVLGDNRNISVDSRSFGIVREGHLVGRVFLRLWPISKIAIY